LQCGTRDPYTGPCKQQAEFDLPGRYGRTHKVCRAHAEEQLDDVVLLRVAIDRFVTQLAGCEEADHGGGQVSRHIDRYEAEKFGEWNVKRGQQPTFTTAEADSDKVSVVVPRRITDLLLAALDQEEER
jgi:hypothetical protein